jgi:DNA-binding response OmpR family regulator
MEPKDVETSVPEQRELGHLFDRHSTRPREHTILVVEDDAQIRDLLSTALQRAGYRVYTAQDGEDGWVMFERLSIDTRIDLLLADVVMPRLGGVALAERVHAASPSTKVLFISGYRDQDTPAVAVVLNKPFGYDSLLERVRQALGRPRPLP